MKIGVVDVGGGLRGIYAAGVLDYCMDQSIRLPRWKIYFGIYDLKYAAKSGRIPTAAA